MSLKRAKYLAVLGVSLSLGFTVGLVQPGFVQTPAIAHAEEIVEPVSVTMSHDSGVYADPFSLTLSGEGAKDIYYTLDGSNPVTSSTRKRYEGAIMIADRTEDENYVSAVNPLLFDNANVMWNTIKGKYTTNQAAPAKEEVDKATVVKAVAVDSGDHYGAVETNTYFVGTVARHIKGAQESAAAAGIPLSVMSISVAYEDLFDYETGIYVKGKMFDDALAEYLNANPYVSANTMKDLARRLPANYSQKGKDWEREAHVDYFETDGTALECLLQQDCGIRIQGNYSRSDLMKSFRLYARADYGKKNFKYPFFEDAKDDAGKVIDKYKKLVLRNGGNYAFSGTKYNDTYWQSMLADLDCETQSSRACVVYIDGEYWGLYVLQQDYDDNYFEVTHGVDKDSVVVYKASDAGVDAEYGYKLDEGNLPDNVTNTDYFYEDLLEFFSKHTHLKKEEDYQEFIKLVDPQSVMDYFAVNVWVNNKWDWPGKNWSMWKSTEVNPENSYADGRWRFCYYDMDFGGCGGSGEIYANTIKEDNYNTSITESGYYTNEKGLLGQSLTGPLNPALQCFILLMTNENFREAYKTELDSLADTVFAKNIAVEKLDQFKGTYDPLFAQFYERYSWNNDHNNGYAGYNNLKTFVTGRKKGINANISFIDTFFENYDYAEPTPEPTPELPAVSPSPNPGGGQENPHKVTEPVKKKIINKLTVTARKNKKVIQVKTVAKAKVTIALSKKIIINGKRKVKKITVTASKKGTAKIKLSKKLSKGIKITVTVKKSGYQTKKKSVKIK